LSEKSEQSLPAGPIVLVVACALVDPDGRVLVAQRPAGKPMAGLWEFPGGKIHPGESPEAALIRELEEELGISTHASCLAPLTFASHRYESFLLLLPALAGRAQRPGEPGAALGPPAAAARAGDAGSRPAPDRPALRPALNLVPVDRPRRAVEPCAWR
jgi:8-oxo-dGTP diphosphatase